MMLQLSKHTFLYQEIEKYIINRDHPSILQEKGMIPSYLPIHRFSSSLQNALVLSWTLSSISKHLLDIIFFFLISHCYLKYGLSKIELNIFCKFDSLYNLREIIKEIPVIYLFRSGTTNSSRPLPQPKDHTYIQFFT